MPEAENMYNTDDPEEYNNTCPRLNFQISNFTRRSLNTFSLPTLLSNAAKVKGSDNLSLISTTSEAISKARSSRQHPHVNHIYCTQQPRVMNLEQKKAQLIIKKTGIGDIIITP
jgi:hypothetical protein